MSGSAIPSLNVFSPGIGVYPASWANTAVQGGCLLAHLKVFSGIDGMTVYMVGFTSANDGGQGSFVWNSDGVGADDGGVTVIVPYGATQGFWERCDPIVTTPTPPAQQTAVGIISNIAALRSFSTSPTQSSQWVQGYFTAADGGEGMFWLSSDLTSPDNGGTVIVDANGRRWYREKQGLPLMLSWFGGVVGLPDCTSALSSALAALPSPGGEIHVAAGTHTLASAINYTYPAGPFSVTLTGEGADNTILVWTNNAGMTLNASNYKHTVHVRDITFRAGAIPGASFGLTLNQALPGGNFGQNDIVRVTFDGTSGSNSFNWAIKTSAWCNINYDAVLIYSASAGGIQLNGNAAVPFQYSIIHNVDRCGFYGCATGIQYGSYVQGLTVSQTNFVNGTTGILVPSGAAGNLSQLAVIASEFTLTGSSLNIQSPIDEVQLSASLIIVADNTNGVLVTGAMHYSTFTGNVFVTNSLDVGSGGIVVSGAATDCMVTGNTFNALSTAISLGVATTEWNVQSNHYSNCTTNVANNGSVNTIGGGSA